MIVVPCQLAAKPVGILFALICFMKDFILPLFSFLLGSVVLWLIFGRPQRGAVRALDDLSVIYNAMRDVVDITTADRFLILRGSNGGGLPRPGADFHLYLVHEAHKNPHHESVKALYNDIVADESYIGILRQLNEKGVVQFVTRDMPTGLLKIIFLSEEITCAHLYFLAHTRQEVFFALIATHNEFERFKSNGDEAVILLAIGRIRKIFKKYY